MREALRGITEPTEVCFFGGSFTCQPLGRQRDYLEAALAAPSPVNFRISTHPLCVDPSILAFLSPFPVRIIELGVSSLEDEVLETCKRGYTGAEVLERLSLVAANPAFIPGAQLMTGLPGQTPSSSLEDLRHLAAVRGAGPMQIRICLLYTSRHSRIGGRHGGLHRPQTRPRRPFRPRLPPGHGFCHFSP